MFTVNKHMVQWSGTPVVGQKGSMQVKTSQLRHFPDNGRKHTEGDNNKNIGVPCGKLFQEYGIF